MSSDTAARAGEAATSSLVITALLDKGPDANSSTKRANVSVPAIVSAVLDADESWTVLERLPGEAGHVAVGDDLSDHDLPATHLEFARQVGWPERVRLVPAQG